MLGSVQRCGYPSGGGEHAIDATTPVALETQVGTIIYYTLHNKF
jgi:hypothetical protein